jgi:chromosome segregation ATPase
MEQIQEQVQEQVQEQAQGPVYSSDIVYNAFVINFIIQFLIICMILQNFREEITDKHKTFTEKITSQFSGIQNAIHSFDSDSYDFHSLRTRLNDLEDIKLERFEFQLGNLQDELDDLRDDLNALLKRINKMKA